MLTSQINPLSVLREPGADIPSGITFALEARRLTLVRGRLTILRNVNLAVSKREMVALRGANGAGKTTLLHCLAGALRPSEGEVLWFGEAWGRSPASRRHIGFLGHDSSLYLALTARENLLFAGRMYGVDRVAERADRLLAAAGLAHHNGQIAERLSRGQRQRLAIARAVIHDPRILLLDEPFTNLDSNGCRWLREFLGHLRTNGCAMVIASHEVESQVFDRSIVLDGGPP